MVARSDAETVMQPPARSLFLAEFPRALIGAAALPFAWRGLMRAPRGDGRPVLLMPGLFNADRSNIVLRRYLNALGYRAEGWGMGRNLGPRTIGREAELLFARIEQLAAETGQPVTLVGISLGGIMARIAAHRRTDLVREVITISSPFAGPATATNVWRAYELLSGERIADPWTRTLLDEAAQPLPVPATAIWSRSDGLVNGMACHAGDCRSVEVRSSHLWVQLRPAVLRAVAEVLAGGRGGVRSGPRRTKP